MTKNLLRQFLAGLFPPAIRARWRYKQSERRQLRPGLDFRQYWTEHNVTGHEHFATRQASSDAFEARNLQYIGYLELMPVSGMDGKTVLDLGCGPGHDVVGFLEHSRPAEVVGADVSASSLKEAEGRAKLHAGNSRFVHIDDPAKLPFGDASFDVVHSSGAIHHDPAPMRLLREIRRVLKPAGHAQIMVYHYHSIFVHLYTAYMMMVRAELFQGQTLREAFRRLTDGPHCPVSQCYTADEFLSLGREAGFMRGEFTGAACAVHEMALLPLRFDALCDNRLGLESRRFLHRLSFDKRGLPIHDGRVAGIDACYRLTV